VLAAVKSSKTLDGALEFGWKRKID
jgi:hypothetical protein